LGGITNDFHMLDTKPMWKYLSDAKYINILVSYLMRYAWRPSLVVVFVDLLSHNL
jgi:hypothetical protein